MYKKLTGVLFILFISFQSASAYKVARTITSNSEPTKEYLEARIDDIDVIYNIGFNNTLDNKSDYFYDIKISFSSPFEGELLIFREGWRRGKTNYKLLQTIPISGNTYQDTLYKESYGRYVYQLKSSDGILSELSNIRYDQDVLRLIVSDTMDINPHRAVIVQSLDYSQVSLRGFNTILLNKELDIDTLSRVDDFVLRGGNLIILKDNFQKYFEQKILTLNHGLQYENYPKKGKVSYYSYGIGKVYVMDSFSSTEVIYFRPNKRNSSILFDLLLDAEIMSKFVPYYIILIFLVTYFIFIVPLNFYLNSKVKNKLFFLYSIPVTALSFLLILISLNFYYKGVDAVENTLELNEITDNKVVKNVFVLNYSPYGGTYDLEISNEDFIPQDDYNLYSDIELNKEFQAAEKSLFLSFERVKASEILTFIYGGVFDVKGSLNNVQYDKEYDSFLGFTSDYYNLLDLSEREPIPYKEFSNYFIVDKVKRVGVIESSYTDYSSRYSLSKQRNKSIRIDVYYE